uniref:Reverse transcriptase domain-containing protein n=1 Tax=Tanacetum cinerariifolium TaxID=118510 RepID=A0A6L2LCM3_TANCI|nr:hypothetical protein [Tanacetum cinerariifolium]
MGHDDEIVLAHVRISTLEMIIEDISICHQSDMKRITMVLLSSGFLEPSYPGIMDMINDQDIEHMISPTPRRDTEPPIGSPISLSPSSSVGSSSPVKSTSPPPDYPFDESIFIEMASKRTSISAAPAMTQAAIRKLVTDSVAAALEAQVTTMANTNNTNRNTQKSGIHVARNVATKSL